MAKATHSLMTADELLVLPDDGMRHELINGELLQMSPSGIVHSRAIGWITHVLSNHIVSHDLGPFFGAEGGFIISRDPDTVLAPDFAFIAKSRARFPVPDGFYPGAPDLAVEVLSPHDRVVEVDDKIQRWLDAGSHQVWIVNPNRRTLVIHRKDTQPQVLQSADRVTGNDLLPGFQATVEELLPARDKV
jgi:Uma2 family endonuclease